MRYLGPVLPANLLSKTSLNPLFGNKQNKLAYNAPQNYLV